VTDDAETGNLRHKAARGVKWTVVQTLGARAVTFGVFLLLARLLAPDAFGLFAYAQAIIAVIQAITDSAISSVVVQREEVTDDYLDALFWVNVGASAALTVGGLLGGGLLAGLLHQPALGPVLRWLSPSFLIAGFSTIQTGILRREFRFRSVALRALIGEGVGGALAVAAALSGAGIWSLVVQRLVAATVGSVVLWTASSWRPSWRFPYRTLRGTGRFAASVSGSRLVWVVTSRVDDFLIGLFLGPVALGYYTIAYRITQVLCQLFSNTLLQVALASFSRVRENAERLQGALKSALRLTSFVGVPVFLWVVVCAGTVVPVVFGQKWTPSIPTMRVLALMGLIRSLQTHGEAALVAVGRPDLWLRIEAVRTVVMIGGFLLVVHHGILWIAWTLVLSQYVASPILSLFVSRLTGVTIADLVVQYRPAVVAGAAMVVALLVLDSRLGHLPGVAALGLQALVAAVVYAGTAWLAARDTMRTAVRFALASFGARG
jgi:PST family polysaccharide transporter